MVRLGRGGRGVVELTFRGQPVVQILPRPATASHIELIRPNRDPIVIEAGSRTVFRLRACFCHAATAANLMPTTRRHYSARSAIVSISRRSQSIRGKLPAASSKLLRSSAERRAPSVIAVARRNKRHSRPIPLRPEEMHAEDYAVCARVGRSLLESIGRRCRSDAGGTTKQRAHRLHRREDQGYEKSRRVLPCLLGRV